MWILLMCKLLWQMRVLKHICFCLDHAVDIICFMDSTYEVEKYYIRRTRARDAALNAFQSPLLDIGIERATGIVWNITGYGYSGGFFTSSIGMFLVGLCIFLMHEQCKNAANKESSALPASFFHSPAHHFNYSGVCYGVEGKNGSFYSPLTVMPLKSDGSLCITEALSRSQPQGMVAT